MKKIKNFRSLLSEHSWQLAGIGVGSLLLIALLWFRLDSLTYGNAADVETATATSAASWQTILANPLYAPYTAVVRLLATFGYDNLTAQRLVSTLYAALAAGLFYLVARGWHSLRVALLASWLFISSAWFLHVGRLGTPEILWLVSMLAIVVVLTPNKDGRHNRLALPSTLGVLAVTLYVPGMVWLVLAGVLWQRKNIREAWQATHGLALRGLSILLALAIIAPLLYGLSRDFGLVRSWLGAADGLGLTSESAITVGRNLLEIPKSLFVSTSFDAAHWLSPLALLGAFEAIMLLLGMYFYATHLRAARTKMIVVLAGVACLLVGIAGPLAISLVVPVIYLLAAAGIAYTLHLWLKVFPVNPIARTIGIAMISLAILLTSIYQTRSYFVAWRYNEATQAAFTEQL